MPNLKTLAAAAALSAAELLASAGCHHVGTGMGTQATVAGDGTAVDTSGMSKAQVMARGNALVRQGQTMKNDGEQMSPTDTRDGLSRNDLMQKGDEMIRQGTVLRDQAAMGT